MATSDSPPYLVLVAEDDLDTRRLLVTRLRQRRDVEVVEVGDGAAALDALVRRPPTLICLDLGLPVVSGYEVCRRLKSDPRTRRIPILVVSGRDCVADLAWAHEMGVEAFLSKPFKAPALMSHVDALLTQGPSNPHPSRRM